jgi:hypothetical protein
MVQPVRGGYGKVTVTCLIGVRSCRDSDLQVNQRLERDHLFDLSMIFSENRCPLFRITI